MAQKRYSDKELQVFLWIFAPYTIGLNSLLFGDCLYDSVGSFLTAFGLSSIYFFIVYLIFGLVAVLIQKRFPANHEMFRRIAVMLPVFYMMNVLLVTGVYLYYNKLTTYSCPPRNGIFFWAIAYGCLSSTVITFLNEGIANWDRWKASVTETEQLKNAYRTTKLLGLKGQINPHFLFNCFNSLSSLINEDQEKAEAFLDEMTKVHRYMLRSDDEKLVSLKEEIKFARSYLFLTSVRFGDAIQSTIDIDEALNEQCLPPLSLQVILENIIYSNRASKSSPLWLRIEGKADSLFISNAVKNKTGSEGNGIEEGLDNLVMKYRLLHVAEVVVNENSEERTIILPLLKKEEATT